jgi:hypothetical protein
MFIRFFFWQYYSVADLKGGGLGIVTLNNLEKSPLSLPPLNPPLNSIAKKKT